MRKENKGGKNDDYSGDTFVGCCLVGGSVCGRQYDECKLLCRIFGIADFASDAYHGRISPLSVAEEITKRRITQGITLHNMRNLCSRRIRWDFLQIPIRNCKIKFVLSYKNTRGGLMPLVFFSFLLLFLFKQTLGFRRFFFSAFCLAFLLVLLLLQF